MTESAAESRRPTRDEVMARAGAACNRLAAVIAEMSPREQAEAAWRPGGPSVDELEQRIRARRALPTQRPAGPAPSAHLLTPAEAAERAHRSTGRVRRWLADGSLHGHRVTERRGGRWDVPTAVVDAWLAGLDPDGQRRACPLCEAVQRGPA